MEMGGSVDVYVWSLMTYFATNKYVQILTANHWLQNVLNKSVATRSQSIMM